MILASRNLLGEIHMQHVIALNYGTFDDRSCDNFFGNNGMYDKLSESVQKDMRRKTALTSS